ncbi:hypothetical protein [Streptomyces sp. CA-111067]|uniref:hypothetical protein n=1 Tax=Streptomyces sp. CA-111067 TaxID=3240046 RepID=UPI003D99DFB8
MTDTTAVRRQLLAALIDRVEQTDLLGAETPLLRPLVEAETRHGQAVIDQFTADAPWLKATAEDHQAAAVALDAVRLQCQDWIKPTTAHTGESRRRDETVANAAGVLLDVIAHHLGTTADAVAHCSPLVNPACPGHTGTDRCDRAPSHAAPTAPTEEPTT